MKKYNIINIVKQIGEENKLIVNIKKLKMMQTLDLEIGTILKAQKGITQGNKKLIKSKITGILFSGICNIRNKKITEYETINYYSDGSSKESFISSYSIADLYCT